MARKGDWGGEIIKSKVYMGDDEIVRVTSIGDQTPEEAIEVRKAVLELGKRVPGKIKILNDLSQMGKSLPGSRAETVKSIKLEEVGKVASFGATTANRIVANFIVKACGMGKKVKYFKTEAEALKWLKE